LSELLSIVLFLASVAIYASKAGRNTWWFTAILLVLGFFVLLNITLYASNYFTGDGINDAVIYTLTNSLTGAGVRKYLLPGAAGSRAGCGFWRAGLGAAPSSPSPLSLWL
jgi:phosphoglycerol transferase